MRFKTIIKLESDANNKDEALDLVEEYLSGNIVSGVRMTCKTRPVCSNAKVICVTAISVMLVAIVFILGSYVKHPQSVIPMIPGMSAVEPPLKTSNIAKKNDDFKKNWENRHTKEALDLIKQ